MVDARSHGRSRDDAGRDNHRSRTQIDPVWIDSRTLFGPADEVVIRHGDQVYRLKITKYGKLILNK